MLIFLLLDEKSPSTKDEASEPQHFVRTYKDRNGCWIGAGGKTPPGMRMSMAIRPQTVANLATKFDSIIKEKQPVSKSNSRQLKLRTYDISKIISELNRLNSDLDPSEQTPLVTDSDKNCDKPAASKCEEAASGNTRCDENPMKKTQDSSTIGRDTVRGNGDVSSDGCGEARKRRAGTRQQNQTGDKFSNNVAVAANRSVVFSQSTCFDLNVNNILDKKKTVSFLETETPSSLSTGGSLQRAGLRSGLGDNDSLDSGLTTPRAAAAENKKEVCVTLTFHDSQLLI